MVNLTIRLSKPGEPARPQASTLVPHLGPGSRSSSFKEPLPVDSSRRDRGGDDNGEPAFAKGAGTIGQVAGVDIVGRRSSRSIGRKVHFCIRCDFPIAIYGRLQPCHHAFCLTCASNAKQCPICKTPPSAIEEFDYHEGMYICGIPSCHVSFPSHQLLLTHVVDHHADITKVKAAPSRDVPLSDAKPGGQNNAPSPAQSHEADRGPDPQSQGRPHPGGAQSAPPAGGPMSHPPHLAHMQGYRPPLPPGPFSPNNMRPRQGPPMEGGGAAHDGFRPMDGGPQGPMGMNMGGEFRPMGMHMSPRGPLGYPGMGYDGGPRRPPGPYGGGQPRPMDPMMEGYGWGMPGPNMGAGHAYLPPPGSGQTPGPGPAGHGQWRPPMS